MPLVSIHFLRPHSLTALGLLITHVSSCFAGARSEVVPVKAPQPLWRREGQSSRYFQVVTDLTVPRGRYSAEHSHGLRQIVPITMLIPIASYCAQYLLKPD